MAAGRQLSDANPAGTCLGQSATDLISFYGAPPAAQRSGGTQGTFTTTLTQSTGWGFLTSTAGNQAIALLTEIRAALVAAGLIAGA